jgi:hypothetical protein
MEQEVEIHRKKAEKLYSMMYNSRMLVPTGPSVTQSAIIYVITGHPDRTSHWNLLFRREPGDYTSGIPKTPIFERGISCFTGAEDAEVRKGWWVRTVCSVQTV